MNGLKNTFSKLLTRGGKPRNPMDTEFKAFFRLRLQDKPIMLTSKAREVIKTNRHILRGWHYFKVIMATILFWGLVPGTMIPGQFYAKMMLINTYFYATVGRLNKGLKLSDKVKSDVDT